MYFQLMMVIFDLLHALTSEGTHINTAVLLDPKIGRIAVGISLLLCIFSYSLRYMWLIKSHDVGQYSH